MAPGIELRICVLFSFSSFTPFGLALLVGANAFVDLRILGVAGQPAARRR